MTGFDYSDCYVAACERVFSSYRLGKMHERDCQECQDIIKYGEPEREYNDNADN